MEEMASNICKHGASTASSVRIKALQLFGSDCKLVPITYIILLNVSTELPGYRPSSGHYVKRGPAIQWLKTKGFVLPQRPGGTWSGTSTGAAVPHEFRSFLSGCNLSDAPEAARVMEGGSDAAQPGKCLTMRTEFIFYLRGSHSAMAS
jgi:hypothetical protein